MIAALTGGYRKSNNRVSGDDTMMDLDELTTVHDMKAEGFRVNNVMDPYIHCYCGHRAISNYSSNHLELSRDSDLNSMLPSSAFETLLEGPSDNHQCPNMSPPSLWSPEQGLVSKLKFPCYLTK